MARMDTGISKWTTLANQAETFFMDLFWTEKTGCLADCILSDQETSALNGVIDTAIRSNSLFAVSLDVLTGKRAQKTVQTVMDHLLVPGAIRSLAPLPLEVPLPVYSDLNKPLNDPYNPYMGKYQGDENTKRKPAYHNGTAWTFMFPLFCEALAKAWNKAPKAIEAALSYLGSIDSLIKEGCIGQLPEIVDGDAPHSQRGCDAQAWSATEALRVWKWLKKTRC
jgi:glycogen debranching enzyme